ncbi:hypothetical protein RchiOBHm_Chr5g0083051 [Rosa chinensis]|uniref:Uncharacterized protein n=1 Tax=Rosa chinensis TaxID=74649 RepID=A0A2P6QNF3_ROSCH|nr:hypothetical protein RchiOBHm_Chr5g0083051 [Rosa chinensis]
MPKISENRKITNPSSMHRTGNGVELLSGSMSYRIMRKRERDVNVKLFCMINQIFRI